jgi:hypothetical protein
MKLSLLTVICALALSIPAQADSLNTVTANAVFQGTVGNLVIAPKTFTVFFEWDVTTDSLVPNTLLAEGPFGPLSLSAGFFPTSSHFMNFIDGFGDNLQISFLAALSSPGGSFDTPGVYGTGNFALFCAPPSCPISDENPFGSILWTSASSGNLTVSNASVNTPEPPSWLLLLAGMLAVAVFAKVKLRPHDLRRCDVKESAWAADC